MARGAITTVQASIKCAACGTKTYAHRTRCPRCRAEITTPAVASVAAARRPTAPLAIAAIVGLILTAGVVVQIGTSNASVAPTSSTAPAHGAPGGQSRISIDDAGGISPTAQSMDGSRDGLAAYEKGDLAGSIEQFTEAVGADPKNAQASNNLGQALVRAGRARDAIPHFDRAISLSGGEWTYHFNRAKAYGDLQEWQRAIADYRRAAELFPQDYATAFNLARALQASGDLNGAVDEFQRAINLAPSEPDFPLALAYVLETARRPGDAVKAYQRYLELQDSGPTADKVKQRIHELESNQ